MSAIRKTKNPKILPLINADKRGSEKPKTVTTDRHWWYWSEKGSHWLL